MEARSARRLAEQLIETVEDLEARSIGFRSLTDSIDTTTAGSLIFVTVDHCSAECLGVHAIGRAMRFEALEPLRQGVRACFGAFVHGIAGGGLRVRHDHGSQFVADEFALLGIATSPAFVREPEGDSRGGQSGAACAAPGRSLNLQRGVLKLWSATNGRSGYDRDRLLQRIREGTNTALE